MLLVWSVWEEAGILLSFATMSLQPVCSLQGQLREPCVLPPAPTQPAP